MTNPFTGINGVIGKNMNHVRITANSISGTFRSCILGPEFPEEDVLVDTNHCFFSSREGADGIAFDHGKNVTVSRNTVENARAFGITFRGPDHLIDGIIIDHNVVRNGTGGAAISVMGGKDRANGPRDVMITDNRLIGNVEGIEALNVKGKIVIRGNTIMGTLQNRCTAFDVKPLRGAMLDCERNRITGCKPGVLICSLDAGSL